MYGIAVINNSPAWAGGLCVLYIVPRMSDLTNERRCMGRRRVGPAAGSSSKRMLTNGLQRQTYSAVRGQSTRGLQGLPGLPGLPELPECRMASGSFPPRGQTTPKQDPSRPPEQTIVEGSLPYCTDWLYRAWLPPTSLALSSALLHLLLHQLYNTTTPPPKRPASSRWTTPTTSSVLCPCPSELSAMKVHYSLQHFHVESI